MVSVLVRGKWVKLDGVGVERDSSNAFTLQIPLNDTVSRRVRRACTLDAWDGAEFLLDDQETAPCVATREAEGRVHVSVWVF